MRVFHDIREADLSGPTYLTIGNFDGVHRGHQVLLREMQRLAREAADLGQSEHVWTALVTFDPHPLAVLRPEIPVQLLTTPQERLEIAAQLGIEVGVIQPFDLEIARMTPRQFMGMLKQHLGLASLVSGPDFVLGRYRSGNLEVLEALGQDLDYTVTVLQPVAWEEEHVRSSRVRELIQAGRVGRAAELLGRVYQITGVVVEGDHRGRQIGIPTANIRPASDRLLPKDGVYATRTWLGKPGETPVYQSVTNVGVRPTVDGRHHTVETHLLDFPPAEEDGDLYGRTLTIEFVAWLRGEQRFAGLDALVAQIQADIQRTRMLFQATSIH